MRHQWLVALSSLCTVVTAAKLPNTLDNIYGVAVGGAFDPKIIEDGTIEETKVPIKILRMRVRSDISLRYARTAIVARVRNHSRRPQQATFQVLLPDTAFISGFTMFVNKQPYDAIVKEKEEAKAIYDRAVSKGTSAAHIAAKARDSNHFTISFNLEGNGNATYRLTYEEFLVRRNGMYNHAINLHPGALVPNLEVQVHIRETQKITRLRVPEVRTGNEVDATENDAQNSKAVIRKGEGEGEVIITFRPDLEEQKRLAEVYLEKTRESSSLEYFVSYIDYDSAEKAEENRGILGQFVVQYDVNQPKQGEILVNDGYFVHFFAPSELPTLSKHVVFVLDTSDSMEGRKIDQLRNAMKAILADLHPSDYFSIVEFNSDIIVHDLKEADSPAKKQSIFTLLTEPTPIKIVPPAVASPENIAKAKVVVSRFYASGGTNIYAALTTAMDIIQKGVHPDNLNTSMENFNTATSQTIDRKKEDDLEPVIIFLTDGDPTVGEVNVNHIISHISKRNAKEKQTPLYSLAFGESADRDFLRRLSIRNDGFMRQIYEAADAALQLHNFYRQVSSPLLSHVKFLYPRRQITEGSLSRAEYRTITAGSEVAITGKVAKGVTELTSKVSGSRCGDNGHGRKHYEVTSKGSEISKDTYLPLERLWAYLTIKQLLDKNDASEETSQDDDDSPKKKALDIALRYSFVTPLTSLVVVKLNESDVLDNLLDDTPIFPPSALQVKSRANFVGHLSKTTLTISSNDGPVLFAESTKQGNSFSGVMQRFPDVPNRLSNVDDANENWGFSPLVKYNLDSYVWAQHLLNDTAQALVFKENETTVILKLVKDGIPLLKNETKECPSNKTLTNAPWTEKGSNSCVYISRCPPAYGIKAEDYKNIYCYIEDSYAGICCPDTAIIAAMR